MLTTPRIHPCKPSVDPSIAIRRTDYILSSTLRLLASSRGLFILLNFTFRFPLFASSRFCRLHTNNGSSFSLCKPRYLRLGNSPIRAGIINSIPVKHDHKSRYRYSRPDPVDPCPWQIADAIALTCLDPESQSSRVAFREGLLLPRRQPRLTRPRHVFQQVSTA